MSRTVVVEVTAEDIAKGVARDACSCPVARALMRATGYDHVSVAAIGMCTPDHDLDTPEEAQRFIASFDDGIPVQPFTFTVELS